MALLDLSDKRNFRIFLVVDIVLTVFFAVINLSLFPFLAWINGEGSFYETCWGILLILAMALMVLWLVFFFINIKKGRNKRWWLLCIALSFGIIGGVPALGFKRGYEEGRSANSWGSCMVYDYKGMYGSSNCYSMFGKEKFYGKRMWRVYDEYGQKKIIRLFESKKEDDTFNYDGDDVKVEWHFWDVWEYDSNGNYIEKIETYRWFEIRNSSFVEKHDLDGRYYYDYEFFKSERDMRDAIAKDCIEDLEDAGYVIVK